MMIYDIEKKCEPEYLELSIEEAPMSDVLVVNGEQDMVIFELFTQDVQYCLFNSRLNGITSKQIWDEDPIVAVSQDKKYFIEIEAQYDGEDGP